MAALCRIVCSLKVTRHLLDFDQQPHDQDDHNKKPKVIDVIHGSPRLHIPTALLNLHPLTLTFYQPRL